MTNTLVSDKELGDNCFWGSFFSKVRNTDLDRKEIAMDKKKIKLFLLVALIFFAIDIEGLMAVATEGEESIKAVLQEFEKHWNAKDEKAIAPLFHPKAEIKTGQGIVSRDKYIKIIPERYKIFGPLTYKDIEVEIKGNKAIVQAIMIFTDSGRKMKITYIMVLEEGKWLIMMQDY